MKNVLKIVSLRRQLTVEQVEELLHELRRDILLQDLRVNITGQRNLEKYLVNRLKEWPRRVKLILLRDAICLISLLLLQIRQRSENIDLNHFHDLVQVGNIIVCEVLWALCQLDQFLKSL